MLGWVRMGLADDEVLPVSIDILFANYLGGGLIGSMLDPDLFGELDEGQTGEEYIFPGSCN